MNEEISAHLVRLRRRHPFFATLSMFARYSFDSNAELCETDGETVRIDPVGFASLSSTEKTALLLHTTLHAALLHPIRRGARSALVWNTAADIVVNNLILETGDLEPPPDTAVEPSFEGQSVEQVYESLMSLSRRNPKLGALAQQRFEGGAGGPDDPGQSESGSRRKEAARVVALRYPARRDLLERAPDGGKGTSASPGSDLGSAEGSERGGPQPSTKGERVEAERRRRDRLGVQWRNAIRRARAASALSGDGRGSIPLGLRRELDEVLHPRIDWRTLLWRYLGRTPHDFGGFDRRLVHQGLYLDHLESEGLKVYVGIDTSGSIDDGELNAFAGEVLGIASAYGNIEVEVYFVDADVDGPHPLGPTMELPRPTGGGGTDFMPFFDAVGRRTDFQPALIVYLTDGDGEFPPRPPELDTLWVLLEGGVDESTIPFGQVVRLTVEGTRDEFY